MKLTPIINATLEAKTSVRALRFAGASSPRPKRIGMDISRMAGKLDQPGFIVNPISRAMILLSGASEILLDNPPTLCREYVKLV